MPWEISKVDGKFCVLAEGADEPEGCHATRTEAVAQMKALYASESNLAADLLANESNLAADISFRVGDIEDAVAHLKMAIAALSDESENDVPMHLEEALAALGEYGNDPLIADGNRQEHAWSGPIVFEGVVTGDNRVFKSGSIVWEDDTLPWTLRWQKHSGQGHAGSVPVGRVDKIERKEEGSIFGFGVVIPSLNDEAGEYLRLLESGVGGGVSVDGDSAQFEIQEMAEGGQPRIEFSAMRLRALSAVDIPAFNGARIRLLESEPEVDQEETVLQDAELQGDTDPHDGDAEEFHNKNHDEDGRFTSGGASSAELEELAFEDERELDISDMREELAKKRQLASEAAETETAETETAETEVAETEASESELSELKLPEAELEALSREIEAGLTPAERDEYLHQDVKQTGMVYGWKVDQSLVAAAIPVCPSTDAFLEPEFDGPTALTVSPDGKVAGHLALFNSCHIGFPNACVKPPRGSNYQYFHTGEIETAEGELVSVGHLTFKTGHAAMHHSPKAAAEHYDNTGTVAADVRAGEDQFGIWVVGALRNHLSEEDIRAFRSAPLSGDWRRIAGKLELVGALAVNVPGFPVPRVKALVASGETETLFTYLEDGDENFSDTLSWGESYDQSLNSGGPSLMNLNDRLEAKIALAQRITESFADDGDQVPDEKIPDDDLPKPPTKNELETLAKSLTKAQILGALKDVGDLLDDPDAGLSQKDRKNIEKLYSAFIKTDEKGKKTDASGMDVEEFYSAWELSGMDIEEFYNSCHDADDGKFCPTGKSGDGGGRNRNRHNSRGRGGGNQQRHGNQQRQGNDRNKGRNPSVVKEFQDYRRSKSSAKRWAAVALVAAAVLHNPIAASILSTAVGPIAPILGSPAFVAVMLGAGVYNSIKQTSNAAKFKRNFNRSIDRITNADKEAAEHARVKKKYSSMP